MYKLTKEKVLIVLAICLAGIFFAVPNFLPETSKLPNWWQPVSLGLDLRGGSNLLLQVDMDEVLAERMSTIKESVRKTLSEHRINGYEKLSSDKNGVKVKIKNLNNQNQAIGYFKKIDDGLEVTVNEDGFVVINYNEVTLNQLKAKVVEQSIEIVRRRIDELGTKEPVIQSQGADRIVVQLPGVQNPEQVKQMLGKTAKMSFHLVSSNANVADIRRNKINRDARVVNGAEGGQYVIGKQLISGEHLTDAKLDFQNGQAVVAFKFDSIGGKKFGEITKNHIGEQLAIVLDNEVISAPNIQTAIMGGSGVITGNFSSETANDLALLLRSGALPAPLEVLEERTVGAGLGADSINAGIFASIVGLIAVVVFMIAAYGLFGIFTSFTVFINLFLMLGAMSFIGTTLTLPGIAGIILTIGMAVDANVLIFERMREEVKKGRSTKDAADTGFNEAWATIFDSNLTTLVAAAVLFWFGSGPVRGFAVTLAIGILTSMFTSVTVTRMIIAAWIAKFKPTKLPI